MHEPPDRRAGRDATIYDVARAAGVAPSTVSRAFSRPGRVNAATAERIRRSPTSWATGRTPWPGRCPRPAAT